jgi:hypothetical protein
LPQQSLWYWVLPPFTVSLQALLPRQKVCVLIFSYFIGVVTVHGSVSISGNQLLIFKVTFFVLTAVGAVWLVAIGAVLFSAQAISTNTKPTISLANGAVYMSILALALIINVAIIFPACLLLQPIRLWHVIRAEKQAVTPRQRFRGVFSHFT